MKLRNDTKNLLSSLVCKLKTEFLTPGSIRTYHDTHVIERIIALLIHKHLLRWVNPVNGKTLVPYRILDGLLSTWVAWNKSRESYL